VSIRQSLLALTCITIALAALGAEPVIADKMHPEMMSHKRRPGLNAMANCRRPLFNICQGCSITIKMRVPQNGVCPLNVRSMGPFAGQEVVVRPQNGIYGSANETSTAYRPNSGFLGQDHFQTRLFFEDGAGKRTTMTVKVNVLVVPSL
jgi:hypothetical protein